MKICNSCKTVADDSALFCTNCGGTEFSPFKTKRCAFCGQEVAELTIVCPKCHRILPPDGVAVHTAIQPSATPRLAAKDEAADVENHIRKGYDANASFDKLIDGERQAEENEQQEEASAPRTIDREEFLFGLSERGEAPQRQQAAKATPAAPSAPITPEKVFNRQNATFAPIERNGKNATDNIVATKGEALEAQDMARSVEMKPETEQQRLSKEQFDEEVFGKKLTTQKTEDKPRKAVKQREKFEIKNTGRERRGIFGLLVAIIFAAAGIVGSTVLPILNIGTLIYHGAEVAVINLPDAISSMFPSNYDQIINIYAGTQKALMNYTSLAMLASYLLTVVSAILLLFAFGKSHATISLAMLLDVFGILCTAYVGYVYYSTLGFDRIGYGLYALIGAQALFLLVTAIVISIRKKN